MNTRKFKIMCDGRFRGFIFIKLHVGNYNIKVGTIAPFDLITDSDGNYDVVGLEHVNDIYLPETDDEYIKENLVSKVTLNNCNALNIVEY